MRREVAPSDVAAHARAIAPHVDELWVVEDVPTAGGIAQLTHVLDSTREFDVAVGHGLAPAPFRTPMALAMEWATCARLHPGRLRCGIGHGVQSWMRDIGEGVSSPLSMLEETTSLVRALLDGEEPTFEGRYRSLSGWRLAYPPDPPPPISLGVVGPKSLAISGRIAEGTILPEGHGPAQITAAVEHIHRGCAEAGRSAAEHHLTLFAGFHVGDQASYARAPWKPELPEGEPWVAVGDADEVVAKLTQVAALVDSLVLVPLAEDPVQHMDSACEFVLPALRATC